MASNYFGVAPIRTADALQWCKWAEKKRAIKVLATMRHRVAPRAEVIRALLNRITYAMRSVPAAADPAKQKVWVWVEEEAEPSPLYGFRYPKEMLRG